MKKDLKLVVESVRDDSSPLTMRTQIAEAKGDGFKVDLSTSIDGHVVVNVHREGREGWVTYSLSPKALVSAVLVSEDSENQ